MIFSTALRPFLQRRPDALDVIEVEPQTLWLADHGLDGPFIEFTPGIDLIEALPGRKLVHSVGMPLGGSRPPSLAQMELIRATAERLDSPWVSEHLSVGGTPHRASGFFLPPLQTDQGVAQAVRNITAFKAGIGRPVAVETGVAYLARKPFEMPDGDFVAEVAEAADCGILLDLHNLYCNARNGRIDIDDFIARIPLDRVWEVHLAGGVEMDGFWLDSHSGPMPDDLAAKSREIVRALPNLGALNFEIYDTFLELTDAATLDAIVAVQADIWAEAGRTRGDARPRDLVAATMPGPRPDPRDWERTLTEAVLRGQAADHPWPEDGAALAVYTRLGQSFRGSMLARCLSRSVRYLMLRDGLGFDDVLAAYFHAVDPQLYAPLEAEAFRTWMLERDGADRLLRGLLDFDCALLRIVRQGRPQRVRFPGDPAPVFEALAAQRLPQMPRPPVFEMEILPDQFTVEEFSGAAMGS